MKLNNRGVAGVLIVGIMLAFGIVGAIAGASHQKYNDTHKVEVAK